MIGLILSCIVSLLSPACRPADHSPRLAHGRHCTSAPGRTGLPVAGGACAHVSGNYVPLPPPVGCVLARPPASLLAHKQLPEGCCGPKRSRWGNGSARTCRTTVARRSSSSAHSSSSCLRPFQRSGPACRARTHSRTHTRTHTHAPAHAHALTHAHTHTRTRACARTHTRTCTRTHARTRTRTDILTESR